MTVSSLVSSLRCKRTVLSAALALAGPAVFLFPAQAAAYDFNTETVNWETLKDEDGVDGKLANITVSGAVPEAVSEKAAAMKTAANAYAATPTNENKTALDTATAAYNDAVAAAQQAGTLGTVSFSADTVLNGGAELASDGTVTTYAAGQRFVVEADTAATWNIAEGATVTVGSNAEESHYGAALNVAAGGVFAQTGAGTLVFSGNTADADADINAFGGVLYNSGTVSFAGDAVFSGNKAAAYTGADAYTKAGADAMGGALYNAGTLSFAGDTVFSGNIADAHVDTDASSGSSYADADTYGGALYNNGTVAFAGTTLFSGNTAKTYTYINGDTGGRANSRAYGGALSNDSGTVSFAGNTVFSGNTSEAYAGSGVSGYALGGALYNKTGAVSFTGSTAFSGNTADTSGTGNGFVYGGALYNESGTVSFTGNTVFSDNTTDATTTYGGALYNAGSLSFAGNTVFSNNSATGTIVGGAGALFNKGTVSFTGNTRFSGNSASGSGGAFFNSLSTASFSGNTVFSDNTSGDYGGVLFNNLGSVTFSGNTVFSGNAASNGGALYNTGGSATVNLTGNSRFSGNTDSSGANSIFFMGGYLNVSGSGITDMRDPMRAGFAGVSIIKSGSGSWYLGGSNVLSDENSGGLPYTTFTVSEGQLYLYREGEAADSAYADGKVQTGSISGLESFTLDSGAELDAGGSGHRIAAGTITLKDGATLGFDLARHDADESTAQLTLAGNDGGDGNVTVGDTLNVNLLSLNDSVGIYTLASAAGTDFSAAVAAGKLTYKGEALEDTLAVGLAYVSGTAATGTTPGLITVRSLGGVENKFLTWNGSSSMQWGYTDENWSGGDTLFWDGDYVQFAGSGAGTVNINKYGVKVAGMDISAGSYTFTGGKIASSDTVETTLDTDADEPGYYTQQLTVGNAAVTLANEGLDFAKGIFFNSGANISLGGSDTAGTRRYNITGDTAFAAGSTLNITLSDYDSDRLLIEGALSLTGGTVNLLGGENLTGLTIDSAYTLIEATSVSGTFDNAAGNFAFVDPELTYSSNSVGVSFKLKSDTGGGGNTDNGSTDNGSTDDAQINLFAHVGNTFNQRATGAAVGSLSTDHAVLKSVLFMNADQARAAYDYFSGEAYGTTRSALLKNSANVRSAVAGRISLQERPPYADPVWATAWGQRGKTDADGNAASSTNTNFGFLAGWDAAPAENILAGVFAGYERTDVHVKARNSESKVDAFHLGAYAGTEFANGIRLYGSLAYSYLDGKTERGIPVAGVQGTATGKYNGWQVQAFAGVAKDFAVSGNTTLTPYADIAHVWLNTGSTKESGSAAALSVAGNTDNATFTTLGVRGEVKLPTAKGGVSLTGDLGWQHAFGDIDGETVNRFADAGNSFTVRGTGVDKNSALVGVGLKADINAKNTITAGYRGAFGSDSRSHGAQVQWKMRF